MSDHEIRSSDELEPVPARRRAPWAAVATASVGALVAGLVGYAVGHDAADQPEPAAAPITLATGAPATSTDLGGARSAADVMPGYGYGRVVFDSRGLTDVAGSATAWAYDPRQVFSRQTAVAAAAALGVDGEPQSTGGVWVVGPVDGTGRSLQLMPDGWASLSFYDPSLEPAGCAVAESGGTEPDRNGTDATGSGGTDASGTDPGKPEPDAPGVVCGAPEQDLGRDSAAVDRTRTLLADLGVAVDGVELEASPYPGTKAAAVTAYAVVDGQRTGATWSVVWVGGQVQSFYGPLAPLASLGSYDVVGAQTAVARLGDPRFSAGPSWGPYPMAADNAPGQPRPLDAADASAGTTGGGGATASGATASETPPPSVVPGARFAWPVQQVTITKARLGLAQYWQPDGSQVLLPTYELTDDDGGVWSVVAVSDDGLDFAAA